MYGYPVGFAADPASSFRPQPLVTQRFNAGQTAEMEGVDSVQRTQIENLELITDQGDTSQLNVIGNIGPDDVSLMNINL